MFDPWRLPQLLVFSKTLFAQFLHQRAEKRADAPEPLPAGKDSAYAEMHKKMIKLQGNMEKYM